MRGLIGVIVAIALGIVISNGISRLIQKPLHIAEPKIELINSDTGGNAILPGEVIDYAPYITNTGDASVYAAITFTCHCYDADTVEMDGEYTSTEDPIPAFIIEPNSGWELKDTSVNNGEMKRIYAYTEVLKPGKSTPPLCDSIQYNQFTNYTFSKMDDEELDFDVSCNAGNSDRVSIDEVISQSLFGE